MEFTRYIIKVTTIKSKVLYVSIGNGFESDVEKAHLFTTAKLVERKINSFGNNWYLKIEVIKVKCMLILIILLRNIKYENNK